MCVCVFCACKLGCAKFHGCLCMLVVAPPVLPAGLPSCMHACALRLEPWAQGGGLAFAWRFVVAGACPCGCPRQTEVDTEDGGYLADKKKAALQAQFGLYVPGKAAPEAAAPAGPRSLGPSQDMVKLRASFTRACRLACP